MRRENVDYAQNERQHQDNSTRRVVKPRRNRRKLFVGVCVAIVIVVAGGIGGWLYVNSTKSPVPKNISQSVNFPIYYPASDKLPKGYALNKTSFSSPEKNVILYSVNYGGGKKILVSVQKRPSEDDIKSFYANYIPLRNQMNTDLGQAQIGAYGSDKNLKTVVSLPTNKGTWLIITTPYDINQNQLKQFLNSLQK